MTYEEQLSAAKYRAERDQARQEAKGLREELETAEAEYRRHRANLDARYEKKADESRRRGQAMHGMSRLTHERPDSWERLEGDAGKNPFDYCKDVGHRLDTCENSEAYKARDLVRRCKALAGVSE